ncbi:hypothetical protein FFF34_013945 [Inquilinus sp. KBS0705]|nr:hypothetical protein FFF34_013945 [Inquilinus sp. KBS0705]
MRYIILVLLCTISLSASAQWWRGDFKSHKRYPLIAQVKDNTVKKMIKSLKPLERRFIVAIKLPPSPYMLELGERMTMRSAQHNMRYREYAMASYDFSELAKIYVQANRLSEAKWYYLQSIQLSKQQMDHQHTINSLVSLAMVKADLGDLVQAKQDLAEARQLALTTGRADDVRRIDERVKFVQSNKVWLPKSELRYAEAVDATGKSK